MLCVAVLACRPDASGPSTPEAGPPDANAQRFARLTRSPSDTPDELARWVVAIAFVQAQGHVALVDDQDRVVWGTPPAGTPVAIDDDVRAVMAREPLASLHWMVGAWSSTAQGATTTERWCPDVDGRLVGDNRTIVESREVAFELLAIANVEGSVTYLARPGGRTPATPFTLDATRGATRASFSNPKHNFPQRLHYVRTDDDLDVSAEGSGQSLVFGWTGPWATPGEITTVATALAAACVAVREAARVGDAPTVPATAP